MFPTNGRCLNAAVTRRAQPVWLCRACARAGLNNPGAFAIGDTLHTGPPLAFPAIPCFSPELFAYLRCTPGQKKAFLKGLEGAHMGANAWLVCQCLCYLIQSAASEYRVHFCHLLVWSAR